MSAAITIPFVRTTEPLSLWLEAESQRYLALGTDRGLLAARILGDWAANVRCVETYGAEPISVETALDRLAALDGHACFEED